jgi:hypothetical protein
MMKCHQQVLMPADQPPDQHKTETPDPTKVILCDLLRAPLFQKLFASVALSNPTG